MKLELTAEDVAVLTRCFEHLNRAPRLDLVSPTSMRRAADDLEAKIRDTEAFWALLNRLDALPD